MNLLNLFQNILLQFVCSLQRENAVRMRLRNDRKAPTSVKTIVMMQKTCNHIRIFLVELNFIYLMSYP